MTTDQTIESLKLAMAKLCQCYADGYEDCANCPFEGYQSCPLQGAIDHLSEFEGRFKTLLDSISKARTKLKDVETERDILNDFIMELVSMTGNDYTITRHGGYHEISKEVDCVTAIDLIREVGKLEEDD